MRKLGSSGVLRFVPIPSVFAVAELTTRFRGEEIAEIVMSSLAPDNEPLPEGLSIEVRREGNAVTFKIISNRTIRSLLTTLDDILSMSILILRCLRSVEV